jgi:hypothetical protein
MSNPQIHQQSSPSKFTTDKSLLPSGISMRGGRESGQALFVLLVLIIAIAIGFVFDFARPTALAIEHDKQTAAALALAKTALIGYAASDANRPGELPCPDVNNDGQLTLGIDFTGGAGSPCVSLLGRFPWKTLGLPDLRDGSGERLWYALSDNFHAGATSKIDNDTKGTLTITGTSPALSVIAVIFSPGSVVGTQVRDTANENTIANYLEGGNETGIATSTFVTGAVTSSFNDRLLVITGADLMTPVEQRVAREMLTLLQSYKAASACNCYPWAADDFGTPFDDDSVTGRTRGGVPIEDALPHTWASLGITVPPWMIGSNIWGKKFYYAVARIDTETHTAGTLTVDGVAGKRLVLITTGPADASRPSGNIDDYVDDLENSNNDNIFQTPSSTAYARDRIYTIP